MRGVRLLSSNEERDPRETLDLFIGGAGFFTAAFFVITVLYEVTGQDALGWALALLGFVVLLALMLTARHRMTRRMLVVREAAEAAGTADGAGPLLR
jgi:membrane associated rhomboid family serine protease